MRLTKQIREYVHRKMQDELIVPRAKELADMERALFKQLYTALLGPMAQKWEQIPSAWRGDYTTHVRVYYRDELGVLMSRYLRPLTPDEPGLLARIAGGSAYGLSGAAAQVKLLFPAVFVRNGVVLDAAQNPDVAPLVPEVQKLVAKTDTFIADLRTLERTVQPVLESATTVKALLAIMPEWEKYLPSTPLKAQLPAVQVEEIRATLAALAGEEAQS